MTTGCNWTYVTTAVIYQWSGRSWSPVARNTIAPRTGSCVS
jgi:hypothetical protein